jgi:SLT domain-containing protein
MNTYMAATKALATYPPPFNFIAAAAAVGMGLAQVAQIRAQSYSGRALGGPVMGGTPYIVGERGPELFTPNTTGRITPNNQLSGGTTNVNFTIVANDAQGFDDLLLQRRGMITQMISDARLEQGMRA